MNYQEWFEENKKYIYGADVDAWCQTAFEAGVAHGVEQLKPYGYVSEHNCEGLCKFQFHTQVDEVYTDNCTAVNAVYIAAKQSREKGQA